MFYCHELLRKKGSLGIIWMAAMYPKILRNQEYLAVNIERKSNEVAEYVLCRVQSTVSGKPNPRFSLLLSSRLMHGCILILFKQAEALLGEFDELFMSATRPSTRQIDLSPPSKKRVVNLDKLPETTDSSFGLFPDRKRIRIDSGTFGPGGGPANWQSPPPTLHESLVHQGLELASPVSVGAEHILDEQDIERGFLSHLLSPRSEADSITKWSHTSDKRDITLDEVTDHVDQPDFEATFEEEPVLLQPHTLQPEFPLAQELLSPLREPPVDVIPDLPEEEDKRKKEQTPKSAAVVVDLPPVPDEPSPPPRARPRTRPFVSDEQQVPPRLPRRDRPRRRRRPRVDDVITLGDLIRNRWIEDAQAEYNRLLDENVHAPLPPGLLAVPAEQLLAEPALRTCEMITRLFKRHMRTLPEPSHSQLYCSDREESPQVARVPSVAAEVDSAQQTALSPEVELAQGPPVKERELSPVVDVSKELSPVELDLPPEIPIPCFMDDLSMQQQRDQSSTLSMGIQGPWVLDDMSRYTDETQPILADDPSLPILSPLENSVEHDLTQIHFADDSIIQEPKLHREGLECRISPLSDSESLPASPASSAEPRAKQVLARVLQWPLRQCTFRDLFPPSTTTRITAAVAFRRILEMAGEGILTVEQHTSFGDIFLSVNVELSDVESMEM